MEKEQGKSEAESSVDQNEKEALQIEIQTLREENFRLQTKLEEAEKLAIEDGLTGLYNRRGWDKSVEEVSENMKRGMGNTDNYITVLFSDLNDLKQINEESYDKGDQYICTMADLLREVFTRKTDRIARWGGDEFGVISISNKPFEGTAIERLTELSKDDRFKILRYCASIVSFRVGDIDDRDKGFIIEKIMSEKISKVEDLLQRTKKTAGILAKNGKKPTILSRMNKESVETKYL